MGIFGNPVVEKTGLGKYAAQCGTLYCSHLRFEEFKRLILQKPIDERLKIVASLVVPHNRVYYVDEFGNLAVYKIEGD